MEPSDLIVLTPPGVADPALAIAACRAGALGTLDLEFTRDPSAAGPVLARLEEFARAPFGVRLGRDGGGLLPRLAGLPADRLGWVVLAGGDHEQLPTLVGQFRARGVTVFWESTSLAEAKRGQELGVDGLILKGHEAAGRVGTETTFLLLQRWRQHLDGGNGPAVPVWAQGGI